MAVLWLWAKTWTELESWPKLNNKPYFTLYKDLIEMTLKKMDVDKDGRICQDDFEQTIQEEPLLLEAFGPCLPKEKALDNFMKNILGRQDGTKSIKNFFLGLT